VQLGMALAATDSGFSSALYYTPRNLLSAHGLIRYGIRSSGGASLESELAFGPSQDALQGTRLVTQATLRGSVLWNEQLRASLELRYSSSPGYRSWQTGSVLQYSF